MQWSQEPSAGRLDYDAAATQKLFSFLKAMLKYRGGSNLWHTWGPGAVAGLLSTEKTQVRSSLLWRRNLFDAVAEVRRTGSLAAQGLLKDSMVKDAFFGHVFHLLRIEDWKEVSETAQNFLTNVFSGLLNTKLVEDANKCQREQEDRGNNSKSVPMTEAWQTVSKHEVLKAYKRPEVQASTQYLVPAKWNIEQVCRTNVRRTDAKTPEQEADFESLRRMTGNQTWPAFTPETEQRLFCNHALLVHVHQPGSKWDLEKAWISELTSKACCCGRCRTLETAHSLSRSAWTSLFGASSLMSSRARWPQSLLRPPLLVSAPKEPAFRWWQVLGSPCSKTCWTVGVPQTQRVPAEEAQRSSGTVEGMTEEMAQVLRDTIRPEDQQKIMKTLSEKNKPPPVKVAELAKKCYQQSYKKIPAKKVQEAVKRKKKEEAAQPRGTTSKRKAEKPPDAPKKEQSRKYAKVDESVGRATSPWMWPATDGDNGRWRLTHRVPGARQQKSFSWNHGWRWPSRSSRAERGLQVARESDWQENAGGNREASQEVARPAAS